MPRFYRTLVGPLIIGVSVWCAAGTVAVISNTSTDRVAALAPWWMGLIGAALAALVPAWRTRPSTALPALLSTLPWWPIPLPAIALVWTGPLADVGRRFQDVDAIANAWFRRARLAMLEVAPDELEGRAADERLAVVIGRWLDQLATHRRVTGQMLQAKLYPGHPQHWVPAIFDLSRLVHDFLDAARIEGEGRVRQAQEVGLTLIVLATLRDWLRDDSPGQEQCKARLRRRLAQGGRLTTMLGGFSRASRRSAGSTET